MTYFIEGLQGSGKSTLVARLSERLPEHKVFREGDYSPVELAWCAYLTEEEYEKIGESCDTGFFRGMYEDEDLSDICKRCREATKDWNFEEEYGNDILFRFDYPLEIKIDRAEVLWVAGYDEIAKEELIPTNAELFKNDDGTYTVWWPSEND